MKDMHDAPVRGKSKPFTLIELLVAMGVFALLMLALMTFFNSAQKLWTVSTNKMEMFENARIALDLISTDLQCAYYESNHNDNMIYFGYPPPTSGVSGMTPKLAFTSLRTTPPNSKCKSRIAEIQYGVMDNKLYVNITGDFKTSGADNEANWDFTDTSGATLSSTDWNTAATPFKSYDDNIYDPVSKANPDGWKEIIPYVVDMTVSCADRDGNVISSTYGTANPDKLPYMVKIDLTLIDRDNYKRTASKFGGSFNSSDVLVDKNKMTFSRSVIIERGQYK